MKNCHSFSKNINIANAVSFFRILYGIILLAFRPLSPGFFIFYLLGGLSDMADGSVARKTHTESEFGAKLDGAADILFFLTCLIKLFPVIALPAWLWVWISAIAALKILTVLLCLFRRRKLVFFHTAANRLTGLMLFFLPLTFSVIDIQYSTAAVCAAASLAAVQEHLCFRKLLSKEIPEASD